MQKLQMQIGEMSRKSKSTFQKEDELMRELNAKDYLDYPIFKAYLSNTRH